LSNLIDLTGTISNGMWRYPRPFIAPEIQHKRVTAKWGPNRDFYIEELHVNTLVGTYFETPAHLFEKAVTVDQWPIENLIRDAKLLRIPKSDNEAITLQEAELELTHMCETVSDGDSLIFATGWDKAWGDSQRFIAQSPYFDAQLIDWLLAREISFIAADIPSFDNIKNPQGFMHRLFKQGVTIAAPLVNMMSIPVSRLRLYVFPLKIEGVCASPCRILAEY
jgi:kynurenine formamidase